MSCQIDGDKNAPILVIGMAPGDQELVAGSPFVGASGKLLWSCLQRVGLTRADCYIVNTIGEVQDEGSSPSDAQFDKYWDIFDEAINQAKARVALCLGGDAFWRLTGISGGILDWRGYIIDRSDLYHSQLERVRDSFVPYKTSGRNHKKGDPRRVKLKEKVSPTIPQSLEYILPTIHPSYVMRTGYKTVSVLAYDVARVKRALDGTLSFSDLTYNTQPFPLGDDHDPIALDIETSRSVVGSEWINRIGISTGVGTWTAPWNSTSKEAIREALADPDRTKIGHNLAYDIPRLQAAGLKISGPLFDTMFACQTLQPDLPKGLNFVASLYLDTKRWKHKSEDEPELYNALDVAQTRLLYQLTLQEILNTDQDIIFQNMMDALPVLIGMTTRGIKLDNDRRQSWLTTLSAQEEVLRLQWEALHPGVAISSNAQLKKLFYTDLGYKVQKGDDGRPTTDETALIRLRGLYGTDLSLPPLLAWRKVNKLRTSYAEVKLAGGDGCIHPSYTATAKDKDERGKGMAGTGRILPKDPNIAQVPKEGRKLYIPHAPQNLIAEFDYVQAELRVIAAVSGDDALMKRINGPDIHQVHADLWGCSRKEAKNVTYATIYGAGKEKLQKMFTLYGITKTQKECQVLLDKFYGEYPVVKRWRDGVISKVQTERCLRNPFGRLRYFWNPSRDIPAALDFIPQSTVADIMWSSLPGVDGISRDCGGALLTIVYDSYVLELPQVGATHYAKRVVDFLTRPYNNIAPGFYLPVTWKMGPNWGELEGSHETEETEAEEALLT